MTNHRVNNVCSINYFGMLHILEKVRFPRSIKPENADPNVKPDLITFSDGNPDALVHQLMQDGH